MKERGNISFFKLIIIINVNDIHLFGTKPDSALCYSNLRIRLYNNSIGKLRRHDVTDVIINNKLMFNFRNVRTNSLESRFNCSSSSSIYPIEKRRRLTHSVASFNPYGRARFVKSELRGSVRAFRRAGKLRRGSPLMNPTAPLGARLRSITAALKIVGQRDKSRHASGRNGTGWDGTAGDHRGVRAVFTPGGTARTTRTRTPRVGSSSSRRVETSLKWVLVYTPATD